MQAYGRVASGLPVRGTSGRLQEKADSPAGGATEHETRLDESAMASDGELTDASVIAVMGHSSLEFGMLRSRPIDLRGGGGRGEDSHSEGGELAINRPSVVAPPSISTYGRAMFNDP